MGRLKTGETQGFGGLLRITIGGLFLFAFLFLDDGSEYYNPNPALITVPIHSWRWEHWTCVIFFWVIFWSGIRAAHRYIRFEIRQFREERKEEKENHPYY